MHRVVPFRGPNKSASGWGILLGGYIILAIYVTNFCVEQIG